MTPHEIEVYLLAATVVDVMLLGFVLGMLHRRQMEGGARAG